MEEVLKRLSDQEKAVAFVGTTVVQTEQLLRDLQVLDTQARVRKYSTASGETQLLDYFKILKSVTLDLWIDDVCLVSRRRWLVRRW